jgi:precorrin-6B methylase 1
MPGPDLILLGYGVDDTLQLTVQTQRLLAQTGKVYSVSLPPSLARFLKSLRVEVEDLTDRFTPGRPFSECYLDVADHLIRRTTEEQPVCFLSPGNPMFLNSLNRFLFMQAQQRGLEVQVLPGISPIDAIINDLGLDVGTFGLQVFDARRLVTRRQAINPAVPLILVQVAGFSADAVAEPGEATAVGYEALAAYLAQSYPAEHLVTLINRELGQGAARATLPLARFGELTANVRNSSSLFIDAVRPQRPARPAQDPK